MIFVLCVSVDKEARDPEVDLTVELLLMGEVAGYIFLEVIGQALDEIRYVGVVL